MDIFTANSYERQSRRFQGYGIPAAHGIFRNLGKGCFEDVSRNAGRASMKLRAHRGSAFADFNNDGRIDVVVSSLGEAPEIWQNLTAGSNTWLILKLAEPAVIETESGQ
ncbi:MAG: VCBS repeat-containing protein [Bryobacteraceae bacterium]